MKRKSMLVSVTVTVALAVLACQAASPPQDNDPKYALKIPNGLAFSEFEGYESWQTIAVSHNGDKLAVILGNPTMIAAYKAGIPGNGKPFPDGSKIAKIEWKPKKSTEAPFDVRIPESLQ